ncbi:MAG: hypothetical protein EAZ55_11720 [Cytophagales bacterium]|nr:MAG: hypothetical protein EAZ55_11720 [Cytophagales bacterium]
MRDYSAFLMPLFISLGILLGLQYGVPQWGLFHAQQWSLWVLVSVMAGLSHQAFLYVSRTTPQQIANAFLLSIVVRFFVSIIFLFVYLYLKVEHKFLFVGLFFMLYILFTVSEVLFLLQKLGSFKKTE